MTDPSPHQALPLRLLPGSAKLHVELACGNRSNVVLLREPPRPDVFVLKLFWHTPDGKTSPPVMLQMVSETSPLEVAAWLTRVAAGLFAGIMDVPAAEEAPNS